MLWFDDKVEVLREYSDFDLTTVSFTIKCPSVIRLLQYVNGRKHKVKFSRVNVFARDQYRCMYCGNSPGTANLTYDHILPRSKGGKTEWTNIATCCGACNTKKADRTPQEAKMALKHKPTKPVVPPSNKFLVGLPTTPESWLDFLYWNVELENDN